METLLPQYSGPREHLTMGMIGRQMASEMLGPFLKISRCPSYGDLKWIFLGAIKVLDTSTI